MKTAEEKRNHLRAFAQLLVCNWWLKLLSLALAILIYYTLKPTTTSANGRRAEHAREHAPSVTAVIEHVANPAPPPSDEAPKQ